MASSVFTTRDVGASEAFAYWREVICAVFVKLRAEPVDSEPFAGSVRCEEWSDVTISRVVAGPQTVFHSEADQRDDLLMSLQVAGLGVVSQAGRDAVLRPGDFSVYDATRPYRLSFGEGFTQIVVQFPRGLLIDRGVDVDRGVAQRSSAGRGLTDVVAGLVTSLGSHEEVLPSSIRRRLGQQVVDSLASALTVQGFSRSPVGPSLSLRRDVVMHHVLNRLSDPDLSVASVAAAFGLTTRSIQLIFSDGATLQSEIRRLRLERAADALVNPLLSDQPVSRIGGDNGFGDPASFARAFRRHFGQSPSEHRNAATPPP